MSDETLRAEYDELKKNLLHHRFLYDLGQSELEDYEYDRLMLRLKRIEADKPDWITPDSPSQIVELKRGDTDVEHDAPMLSINDVFSTGEVVKFIDGIKKKFPDAEFLVEEKVDGVSAAMRYRNGTLTRVLSRGDGRRGKNITANALSMLENPIGHIDGAPPYVELRGEIFIRRRKFAQINSARIENGLEPFANPRNYTAGLMNSKNKSVPRQLSFAVHDMMRAEFDGRAFETASEFYRALERNGVDVVRHKLCRTTEEILEAIDEIGASRSELDWALDGAVVKVDSFAQRSELGVTEKAPRWSIAYKFPPEIKRSIVREIELNVGRTGKITPVAIFDPIALAGTTVSRATLHNKNFIESLDVRLGSTIEVFKSGEIIPKIKCVVENPSESEPYEFVDECPSCRSKLDMDDWRCINSNCPAQLEAHIVYFAGKNAMDIDGLGKETVRKLIANGLVGNVADIYTLEREELIGKCGFGQKESDNLIKAIARSKSAPPERILTGLGINGVGSTVAETLITGAGSIKALVDAPIEPISHWVGKAVTARATNVRTVFDQLDKGADSDTREFLSRINYIDKKLAERLVNVTDGSLEEIKNLSLEELSSLTTDGNKALKNVCEFFKQLRAVDAIDPVDLLSRLKKVTRKGAKFLLNKFGSLDKLRTLTADDIMSIEDSSVGEGARNIRVAFNQIDAGDNADLVQLLSTISGVGDTYSERLSKAAGSLERLKNASYDEIIEWGSHPGLKNLRRFFDLLDSGDDVIELLTKIKGIDSAAAQLLLDKIGSLEKIRDASSEELSTWLNDAKIVARHVREFFDLNENRQLIERLREMGLNVDKASVDSTGKAAKGETIVFTGTLNITRDQAGAMARAAGFDVKNSVSSKTKYVVAGKDPGSKLTKAQQLGVTILDEEQFRELVVQE